KVNGLIRGVELPAGEHEVRFTYDRSRFETGQLVSSAALVITLLLIAAGIVMERRSASRISNDNRK
ncbi:MAG: hypothetical protein HGA60_01445, partial [Chlorobiaceae bacterium]|nr:hypothetical protein [Chlorobiaceae bacterium]